MTEKGELDSIFVDGPEGFLDGRLREYVEHFNPDLKNKITEPPEAEEVNDNESEESEVEEDNSEFQGADAWKKDAIAYCRELRWGSVDDFKAIWGVDPPPEYLAFQKAIQGANPWSTFNELRLSEGAFIDPDEDKNLFEMIVLLDQLAYLGTNLAEVFSGVVSLASLGNGDTYHYDLFDVPLNDGKILERGVHFWDHETHEFDEGLFADSIESLTFLCALTKAVNAELVSSDVADDGFKALAERVDPSWQFSIEDYCEEEFDGVECEFDMARYSFWRSAWIQSFLRNNGIVDVEDLGNMFIPTINSPLTEEETKLRYEAMETYTATAVYMMWKAFMFDEPELEEILVISTKHKGRIVRDCEKLIREFQNGRKTLGNIADMPSHLERFRALDLDPRRAEEKAKEEAAAAKKAAEEMEILLQTLDTIEPSDLTGFAWEHISHNDAVEFQPEWAKKFKHLEWPEAPELIGLRKAILQRLGEENSPAMEGVNFITDNESSRRGCRYSNEDEQAQRWIGRHLTSAIEAILVGDICHPTEAGGLNRAAAINILKCSKGLDPRSVGLLHSQVKIGPDDKPVWGAKLVIDLLGTIKDESALDLFASLLEGLTTEGGFHTVMHFDDFIAAIAKATEKIGIARGAKMLVPFANSNSFRSASVACAYTIAKLDPKLGTMELCKSILHSTTENNSDGRTARVMVAMGLMGREQSDENKKELLELLQKTDAYGTSYVTAKLGTAVANKLLGGDGQFEAESYQHWLEKCFTKPAYREEYTLNQINWGLEVYSMFPDPSLLEPHIEAITAWRHPQINERLKNLGIEFGELKQVTWFAAQKQTNDELQKIINDTSFGSRWHAARTLAERSDESSRKAFENVMEEVLEIAPKTQGTELPTEIRMLLMESVYGLIALDDADSTISIIDKLLRHPNRNVKDPVLRNPPTSPRLAEAMQTVVHERYGWQESTAQTWLDTHAPDLELAPPGDVPKEAWWDEDDNEWVLGKKDDKDRFHGLVQYWRPDGTICCENYFVDGNPGAFQRFHENGEVSREGTLKGGKLVGKDTAYRSTSATSENAFPRHADERIHSIETYWEDGSYTHQIMRDTDGNQLSRSGDPIPARPESVPEHAVFQTEDNVWEAGTYTDKSIKTGKWTYYNQEGELLREEEF